MGLFLERLCLAPLVASQYLCPCLCGPVESFTFSQSAICYLSTHRNKNCTWVSQQINMPSMGKRNGERQGCTVEDMEKTKNSVYEVYELKPSGPIILLLIASVFYQGVLLSSTKSFRSCERGPLLVTESGRGNATEHNP